MKRPSKLLPALALAIFLAPLAGWTGNPENLFSTVPMGDPAYRQLFQLERAGLLPQGGSTARLTRFEVAQRIWQAQKKYDEIVLAQADDIPPPPADGTDLTPATSSPAAPPPAPAQAPAAPAAPAAAAVPTPATPTAAEEAAELEQAKKDLHSLSEAYQYELKKVQGQLEKVKDHADALDASQYDLWKKLQGIVEYPNVAIHGLGRGFALSQQYFGNDTGLPFAYSSVRGTYGYLDLMPEAAVQKQIRWHSILRLGTGIQPGATSDFLLFRRITLEVKAPWFSATLGDFDESYTPLTLWNRDNLDLRYMPEMIARADDTAKYESFFNNEPNWPLRGLRLGTDVAWPDSGLLSRFQLSAFAHMIANGFNADQKNSGYASPGGGNLTVSPSTHEIVYGSYPTTNSGFVGPTNFTDWIFAGQGRLDLQKWYMGGTSVQIGMGAHLVILDEPLYTNAPGAVYQPFDPTTWAHQYVIDSWDPELRVGLGGDFYIGGKMDLAYSTYRDDKLDEAKTMSDYAMLGGPYLEFGDSKITFNYLNVGPQYYSPLAQTRQDLITNVFNSSPELFQPSLRNQYFLNNVPRAGAIYGFYDRTQDNTFPYGLATPNREGFGLEMDVKALEKHALKVKGSAYLVQEIGGNIVADATQTGYTTVDAPVTGVVLVRKFTYVNVGPSLNIGPLIGWDRDLEIGVNARFEQTSSSLGNLTSTWILGGLKVGVLPVWDLAAAFGSQSVDGTEMGYQGLLWARYSYIFDNTDLGSYQPVSVSGSVQTARFSSVFRMTRGSSLMLDFDLTQGNLFGPAKLPATLNNQFMELTYEIQF